MAIYGQEFKPNLDLLIENFQNEVSLIDNLVLNESIKGSLLNLWDKIIELFRKAAQIFSNFILNINRFKSVRLPKQEIEDLIKCLQVMQPRTMRGNCNIVIEYKRYVNQNKNIDREIKDNKINRYSGPSNYAMNTTLEFEIDKTSVDIKESISSLEKLEEFKRINENIYLNDDLIEIPLSSLIDDMKDSKNNCFEFEKLLKDVSKINNYDYCEINQKMIDFCNLNIKYYQQRISLLNIFFNNARFSSIWTKGLATKAIMTKLSTNRNAKIVKEKISIDKVNIIKIKLLELVKLNESNKFYEYKNKHKELCFLIGIPQSSTFMIDFINSNNEIIKYIVYFEKDFEKVPVVDKPLYHHSLSNNLQEIKPNAIGNFGQTYFPEARIYVHMNFILNKAGKRLDIKNDESSIVQYVNPKTNRIETKQERKFMYENQFVYKIKDKIDCVYRDTEMGDTGVFIETDKPVNVEKINYKDWKKENDIK